jgi:hypothetical protein
MRVSVRTSQPTTTEVEPADGKLCRTGAKSAGLARSDESLGVPAANLLRLRQVPLRATGRCPPPGHGPELETRWAQPSPRPVAGRRGTGRAAHPQLQAVAAGAQASTSQRRRCPRSAGAAAVGAAADCAPFHLVFCLDRLCPPSVTAHRAESDALPLAHREHRLPPAGKLLEPRTCLSSHPSGPARTVPDLDASLQSPCDRTSAGGLNSTILVTNLCWRPP